MTSTSVNEVISQATGSSQASGGSPLDNSDLKFCLACNLCDKFFSSIPAVRQHLKRTHKMDNVTVTEHYSPCYKNLVPLPPLQDSANGGMKLHYQCSFCDKLYASVSNVTKHIKSHHFFDVVKSEHFEAVMRQGKPCQIKFGEVKVVKPKGFVTPRRVAGDGTSSGDVQLFKRNPGKSYLSVDLMMIMISYF